MKKFLKWPVLALLVLLFSFRSKFTESREAPFGESCEASCATSFAESWSDSLIKTLTIDQKIVQLFMVAAWSDEKKESYNPTQIEALIKNNGIGGIIFFQGGPVRQAKLTNRFQAKSKIPLLIGIDAEWGLGMRLDSTISFPRAMTLGASMDEKLIYEFGKEVARQCKRIGVHMNFAPVVDVNSNPKNPVISNRSFGENADRVTSCGMAYMKGMQDNGVIAKELMHLFMNKSFDKVVIVYNQFVNAATQDVRTEQFLPILSSAGENNNSNTGDYIFEPSKEEIVSDLIPKSLKIQLFKGLLDSNAAEHGARMTAMHKATDNAKELQRNLKLSYNKARQAAITNEILEIVGGAEALKS
jgi:hypothetical protein